MAFGIYNLFEAFLLMVNAVAVLHEQRFLDKSECRLTDSFDFHHRLILVLILIIFFSLSSTDFNFDFHPEQLSWLGPKPEPECEHEPVR